MNKVLTALTQKLSYGASISGQNGETSHGFVATLALAYEKARNALEYRADNLVRRAAIERILRRQLLLSKNPKILSENLLTELKWARYLGNGDTIASKKIKLEKVLEKYSSFIGSTVPTEWVVKIASAEIEELFSLNSDYNQFTFYAFQVMSQKIQMKDENLDLLIYFATDREYAGSDDEQIAYHIIKLAGENIDRNKFEEGWKLFNLAKSSKLLPRINKFVRRQTPPLVLLRDMYFYKSDDFKSILEDQEKFTSRATEVLKVQLDQMSGKIATAGVRSIVYVFLTKMVLAFGLEVPFELFFYGSINKFPLILNIVFPPILMWLTTMQIKTPSKREQSDLIERIWFILVNFDQLKNEEDNLTNVNPENKASFAYYLFSVIYAIFFVGVFGLIYYLLGLIHFTFFSRFIFIFFLSIIAFFAYRISQIAKIYTWKDHGKVTSSLGDTISLPILTIGSILSQGLTKLNFLAFAFDFILEAPFKIILGFVDDWVQFLSLKKEDANI